MAIQERDAALISSAAPPTNMRTSTAHFENSPMMASTLFFAGATSPGHMEEIDVHHPVQSASRLKGIHSKELRPPMLQAVLA
eukprot:6736669-Pyramimonas_sp.AAC.1